MKGYRNFILIFSVLFILYVIAELNKPVEPDWTVTISQNDKNPYGGYILYHRIKDLFPSADMRPYYLPAYNQLNNSDGNNSAYFILTPSFEPSKNDFEEIMQYVNRGNYLMIAAEDFSRRFLDSFRLRLDTRFTVRGDSTAINFVNPLLKEKENFTFLRFTMDQYFSTFDTSKTTVLGVNDKSQVNFIKIAYGKGAILIHTAPVCFSNYFMLHQNNAVYTARALSYVPATISKIYWDEYYKPNSRTTVTPLAFFLRNEYLRWALRLAIVALVIYVFFQAKRRQRVIPVITPLRNSSLDFIKTVSTVYFNQRDNKSMARKKISYFLDFIRQRFYLPTNETDMIFIEQLARKSNMPVTQISSLINLFNQVERPEKVSDELLLAIDQQIDNFYKQM